MALAHDSAGFLTGATIQDIRRSSDLLNRIQTDVAAIKRAVTGSSSSGKSRESRTPHSNVANFPIRNTSGSSFHRNRDTFGRFVSEQAITPGNRTGSRYRAAAHAPESVTSAASAQSRSSSSGSLRILAEGTEVATPTRGSRSQASNPDSRISTRDNRGRFTSNSDGNSEKQEQKRLFDGLGNRLSNAIVSTDTLDDVDPTIKAFNEVAQPMARGYQMLFDRDKDKDGNRWFKRIFGELKLFRKEETAFSRAASQSLDVLEEGQGNRGSEGSHSFFGGLMGGIAGPILGAIGGLLSGIMAPVMGALSGIGSLLLKGVTSVLRVVFGPIGLAISGMALAAWGLFTEDGKKFFGEVADKLYMLWYDSTEFIKEKWDDGVKVFTELWDPIAKFFKDKFGMVSDTVSKAANATNAFIKDKTGIDVKQGVKSAGESIKSGINTAQSIPKRLQDRWQEAKSYLADAAQKAGIDPGLLAKIAGFESGFNPEARPTRKDGTRISSAHGLGQFLDSTWVEMVRKHGDKYGVENAGNLSKAEALSLRLNKELQAGLLAEFTKENAEIGRKLGGNNDDSNIYALHNLGSGDGPKFLKALRQNPHARVSDILSKRVIAGNRSLYGSGDMTVAEAYQRMGLAMQRGESFANEIRIPTLPNKPATAQVAAIPSPSMPMLKKPLAVAEAPQIIIPLASDASRKGMTTTATNSDVGQNISDRRIAHIVLGGIGMG